MQQTHRARQMRAIGLLGLFALAGVGHSALAGGETYVNDFSLRTSSGPVPANGWLEMPYAVGSLALNYPFKNYLNPAVPYGNGALFQDNWAKGAYNTAVGGSVSVVAETDGNQYVRFSAPSWTNVCSKLAVFQSFYNSLTDGVLRISADLRAPLWWPNGGTGTFRVQPLFRANMQSLDWRTSVVCSQWGMQKPGGQESSSWDDSRLCHLFGNGQGGGADVSTYFGEPRVVPSHWYRFVMDIDLATGALDGKVYDQGTAHPAKDMANGSCVQTFPHKTVLNRVSAATGPIEGIALVLSTFAPKTDDATDYPSCDNLVCSWKAPDADSFAAFYENDFTTRRYRTLCPSGAKTHVYARDNETTNSVYTGYSAITGSSPTDRSHGMLVDSTKGVVALGGWRRRSGGDDWMGLVEVDDDAKLLISRRTGSGDFAGALQTLGETITAGKVRLSFDFRTPDKWYYRYGQAYGVLSSSALYAGTSTAFAALVGVASVNGNDGKFYFKIKDRTDTTRVCASNTWYRGIVTVDLDARKSSVELHEIGESPASIDWTPSGAALYAEDNLALDSAFTDISSFGLLGYGAGPDPAGHVYFDNVQVWKNWDGTAGTLVYRDTFDAQKRYFSQMRGTSAGALHRTDGQDNWIRRQDGLGETWITSAANPAFAATSAGDYVMAVQGLGDRFKGRFKFCCDIRPPQMWTYQSARYATVRLGGDDFLQGNASSLAGAAHTGGQTYALGVGFGDRIGTKSNGAYRNVSFYATDGTGVGASSNLYSTVAVDTSHWYRFRVACDTKEGKYDVSVYDMGAAHPEAATPVGECVASWTNLGFRWNMPEGFTALGIATYGNPVFIGNDPEDPGLALYDNIAIREATGLKIIVR